VLAERVGKRKTDLDALSFRQSQVIGWAQVLSLIPGTSRSGVTITAGLFQGLNRESARASASARYPFITAAGVYKLVKVILSASKEHQMSALIGAVAPTF